MSYSITAHINIDSTKWHKDGADPDTTFCRHAESKSFSGETIHDAWAAMGKWVEQFGPEWKDYERSEDDDLEPSERRWDAVREEDGHGYPIGARELEAMTNADHAWLADYSLYATLYKQNPADWNE